MEMETGEQPTVSSGFKSGAINNLFLLLSCSFCFFPPHPPGKNIKLLKFVFFSLGLNSYLVTNNVIYYKTICLHLCDLDFF